MASVASTMTADRADEAMPTRPPASRLLSALIGKDVLEHVFGRRLLIGAVISFLLCGLAAAIRVSDYRAATVEHRQFLQRWLPSIQEQIQRQEPIESESARLVSPLTVLSVGLEPVIPIRFTSTKEGVRYGETRAAQNPVDVLFGYIDISFVVTVILSLFATVLSFDSLCGERSDGTLALLMSYPVSRSLVLTSKLVSAFLVTIGTFLPSYIFVLILNVVYGGGMVSAGRWLIFLIAACIYVVFFIALSLSISAQAITRANAALICVLAWIIIVFGVPRAASLVVNQLQSPSRTMQLNLQQNATISKLKVQFARKRQQAFETYIANVSNGASTAAIEEFRRAVGQADEESRSQQRKALVRFWDEQDRLDMARQTHGRWLALLSPTTMFNTGAAEIALTGDAQRLRFYRESRVYDESVGRRLAESRQLFFTQASDSGPGRALLSMADIRSVLIPFQPTWAPANDIAASIAFSLGGLALSAAASLAFAWIAVHRMDVRG